MRSTFMGLETSKRGLFTQQSALYTTGHNISNANTPGFSRQRVNMEATIGYPGTGLTAPKTAGHIGTGVQVHSVQRIRDSFIDTQFRQETNKLGYWESRSSAISQMEDVLNEPSDYGLAKSLNEFWKSLQDLSVNPENGGARAVVVQRGIAVADSFNYMNSSIEQIKENAGKEIGITLKDINSILKQVANLNEQIKVVEPNGYMPNDLYDARDNLLDQLSTYIPIEIERVPNGGNALAIAEGTINVSLKLNGASVQLINGTDFAQLRNAGASSADNMTPTSAVTGFYTVRVNEDGTETNLDNNMGNSAAPVVQDINTFHDSGKLKSLVNSYGYMSAGVEKGMFTDMLAKLDKMAEAFAKEFNRIHKLGTDLQGAAGQAFFDDALAFTAKNIAVSQAIIDNPNLLAASDSAVGDAQEGNGNQALLLANMKFEKLTALGDVGVQTYFEGLIGQLGVDGQQAARLTYNAQTLQQAVSERKASVSSVSLDEEMTNMITFQQAYNANARMITVVDETLDKIINGMGRVGL